MNLYTAADQYARRPQDERFPSLDALVQAATEDRRLSLETTRNWKDLRFAPVTDSNGREGVALQSPKGNATLTHWSFGQAAQSLKSPAAYLRDGLNPELAAQCLNYRIQQTPPGTDCKLLVRLPNGSPTPIVRACTSDTYGRVWDAELYGSIARQFAHDSAWQLPPTWEGPRAGAYRGDRDSFLILTNGGSIVTDPSIGSGAGTPPDGGAMYRGILVRNSEVGASSVQIDAVLYRYICGNHIIWGAVIDRTFKRRHTGENALRDTLREVASLAYKLTTQSAARDEQIIRGLIEKQIAETKEGVIDELVALGFTKQAAADAYRACEAHEAVSPRSFWGLMQGATRVSQDSGYQDERLQMDRLAAEVLKAGRKLVAA